VQIASGRVVAIGKAVAPWDAIDAGCFLLTHAVFPALRAVSDGGARTVSSAMRRLAEQRGLHAVDIDGVRWVDVDTPRDRADAERMLAASQPAAIRPQSEHRATALAEREVAESHSADAVALLRMKENL
jgi:choline kinase